MAKGFIYCRCYCLVNISLTFLLLSWPVILYFVILYYFVCLVFCNILQSLRNKIWLTKKPRTKSRQIIKVYIFLVISIYFCLRGTLTCIAKISLFHYLRRRFSETSHCKYKTHKSYYKLINPRNVEIKRS